MAESASAQAAQSNVTPEVILTARRIRTDDKAALETAKARYRNGGKKIESWGVDLKELDRVIEFSRRDGDELKLEFKTFIHYCRVLQVPIGTQLSLLDEQPADIEVSDKVKEEREAWDAGQQGMAAGTNKEPASNNPYPTGTLAFVAWAEAHRRGTDQVEQNLVVRRGRPPGTGKKQKAARAQQAA